ncbi:hypothetical protein KV565_00010 [Bacillus thuringiensis]|uniref:hypothetical protein n=1 Tax=Bacillus TaxID=1386 RepID=UPI000BF6ACA1|nr:MULTISPECIES: hypothetical protein [Bacillus cereus group]MBV6703569.1 hypothetical protein [Bacillus thuringiensis]PFL77722.1 hypothetical protein COJ31_25480 [Bacillus cereus]PFN66874.1 hypothetical protein COJ59_19440 [Bacillus cereus]
MPYPFEQWIISLVGPDKNRAISLLNNFISTHPGEIQIVKNIDPETIVILATVVTKETLQQALNGQITIIEDTQLNY